MKTIPTIKAAMQAHPLAPAVLRQLGGGRDAVETAIDAGRNGADAGWSGFTYYSDTERFAKRHRAAIADAVRDMASDLGEQPIQMVKGFRFLKGLEDAEEAIGTALYGGKADGQPMQDSVDLVYNALAWFALEEVGRAIADSR